MTEAARQQHDSQPPAGRILTSAEKHRFRGVTRYDARFRGLAHQLNDHLVEELWSEPCVETTNATLRSCSTAASTP